MTPEEMYADTRVRLTELFRSLSASDLELVAPATPEWTVGDIARHLAGAADDVTAGRIEGAASDPWTAKQVDARRTTPIDAVLAEWDEKGPRVEAVIASAGRAAYAMVMDVVTHEQDVRGAVARPGARETDAAKWTTQQLVGFLDGSVRAAAVAPLRILAGTDEYIVGGDGEPGATATIDPFELLRLVMGRRSVNQLRAYRGEGDRDAYIPLMTIFGPAASDVVE